MRSTKQLMLACDRILEKKLSHGGNWSRWKLVHGQNKCNISNVSSITNATCVFIFVNITVSDEMDVCVLMCLI